MRRFLLETAPIAPKPVSGGRLGGGDGPDARSHVAMPSALFSELPIALMETLPLSSVSVMFLYDAPMR